MTPFEFHTGFSPNEKTTLEGEDLHIYDCPFCQKEQHIYYFPSNTTWDCKVCGRSGNNYVFIQTLYNEVCQANTRDLAKEWGLPDRALESVKFNPLNSTYVIPSFRNGKLNNLYKVTDKRMMGTPGIPITIMGWEDDSPQEVWIAEGQKDYFAAISIIGSRDIHPLAVPGANTFKSAWLGAVKDKDLVLLFDNDEAGEKGMDKILEMVRDTPVKPKSIKRVKWPEDYPEKFDLRDFYKEHKGKSYKLLQPLLHPVEERELVKVSVENVVEDFSCDSYDKALDSFSQAFFTTKDMRAALAMTMASIYSINIDGEQLWLKIIGPPGCGKTRIAKAVSASDHVMNLSTFTGLHSGWKDGEEKDAGLVPELKGRTLIIKDADALLRQPNIEKIMSELRDFYDKDTSVRYKNRQQFSYQDIRSTFIMLGTQVLRRADQSFLGERLLTLEMDVRTSEKEAISKKMMERSLAVALGNQKNPEHQIMCAMKGWLNHLRDTKLDASLPQEFQELIFRLCNLTALLRTQVDRNFKRRLQSPAMPELPTRLIGQCVTAVLSLCVVYGVHIPTEEIYRTITKLLKDTINPRSHRFQICDVILDSPHITRNGIMEATDLKKDVVNDELEDLIELGFVSTKKVEGASPGYKATGFELRDEIASPFKEITS